MNRQLLYIAVLIGNFHIQHCIASDKDKTASPLFQLSIGVANSSIDLTRYEKPAAYRGLHTKLITHIYNPFYFSLEYSTFPKHNLPLNWKDIRTNKLDFNGHVSYSTDNNHTKVYALLGADRFLWKGVAAETSNFGGLDSGIMPGTISKIKRWGANCGVGFTHVLYDMISVFGDGRFTLCKTNERERIQITDVMTTFGISFSIPYPQERTGKRSSSLGNKLYKWTKKGNKQ